MIHLIPYNSPVFKTRYGRTSKKSDRYVSLSNDLVNPGLTDPVEKCGLHKQSVNLISDMGMRSSISNSESDDTRNSKVFNFEVLKLLSEDHFKNLPQEIFNSVVDKYISQ